MLYVCGFLQIFINGMLYIPFCNLVFYYFVSVLLRLIHEDSFILINISISLSYYYHNLFITVLIYIVPSFSLIQYILINTTLCITVKNF